MGGGIALGATVGGFIGKLVDVFANDDGPGGVSTPTPGDVADAVAGAGATVKPHPTKTGEGATIKWPDGSVSDVRVEKHPIPGSKGQPVPHGNLDHWDEDGNRVIKKHIP